MIRPFLKVMTCGGVDPRTVKSVYDKLQHSKYTWRVDWQPSDGGVDRQRCTAVEEFKGSGCNVLAMVDHDIVFGWGDLDHLVEEAYNREALVGGVYSKRTYGAGPANALWDDMPHEIGSDEVFELGDNCYLAGGFIAFHLQVIHDIMAGVDGVVETTGGFHTYFVPFCKGIGYDDADGEKQFKWHYLPDDYAFCERVRQSGRRVFATMRPILGHVGTSIYSANEAVQTGPVSYKKMYIR